MVSSVINKPLKLLNKSEVMMKAQYELKLSQTARQYRLHPAKVNFNNIDANQSITDEIVSLIYDARCVDNNVHPNET